MENRHNPVICKTITVWVDELYRWNGSIRLVGEPVKKTFIKGLLSEVLIVLPKLKEFSWTTAVDIGSGNGLVSIPMAIEFPERQIVAVEPKHKKAAFLRHIGHVLQLKNFSVVQSRIGDDYIQSGDDTLWTIRAMEISNECFRSWLTSKPRGRLLVFSSPLARSEKAMRFCHDLLQEEQTFLIDDTDRHVKLFRIREDVSRETP